MNQRENEAIMELIKWLNDDRMSWELLCYENEWVLKVNEFIDILETLLEEGQFQKAAMIIAKMDKISYVHKAIMKTISQIISYDRKKGILMMIIENMKYEVKTQNLENENHII